MHSDTRYRISRSTGEMHCLYCGQSSKTKPNEAIRTVARYYLSLSLPFATCPNEICPNFGINVFEKHCPPRQSVSRDTTAGNSNTRSGAASAIP